jgi:hypothetical protein
MAKKKIAVKRSSGANKTKTKTAASPKKSGSRKSSKARANRPSSKASARIITHEMIVQRAHEIWLRKNHAHHTNHDLQNWSEAEEELRKEHGK